MKSYGEMLFGNLAVEHGLIKLEDLEACYALQRQRAANGERLGLERIMLERGLITQASKLQIDNLREKLERRDIDYAFGRLVVEETLVNVDEVERAIREQGKRTEHVSLGQILLEQGALPHDELARLQRLAALKAKQGASASAEVPALAAVPTPPTAAAAPAPSAPAGSGMPPAAPAAAAAVGPAGSPWDTPEVAQLQPGARFGGYEILREVAKGGMGTIYQARHLNLGRIVAIKVLGQSFSAEPTLVRRFIQEAKALAQLQHPNIVGVYNVGKIGGAYFLEMEFVEGEDLHDKIARENPIPLERALPIAQAVVQALKAACEKGIVHRDVKPENILISKTGDAKLTDFGIVKMQGAGSGAQNMNRTRMGDVIGTPYYIAPEQARGEPDVDFRADIYSLGATIWRMLTGRPPFEGTSALDVIAKHLHKPIPPLAEVLIEPKAYAVLARMLAKTPAERHASWDAVAADLDGITKQSGCPACGSPMEEDHIICIECGFNRKVGVHLQTKFGPQVVSRKKRTGRRGTTSSRAGGVKRRRRRRPS